MLKISKALPAYNSLQIILFENKIKDINYELTEDWSDKQTLLLEKIKYIIIINIYKSKFSF
jgi:hypothetical protein